VLAALTLFFGGMLSYKVIAGRQTLPAIGQASAGVSGHHEAVGIQGRAVMKVLRGGNVVASWKGHNSLTDYAKNAVVGCLSGLQPAPPLFSCTSGMTTVIKLDGAGGTCGYFCEGHVASSIPQPPGCLFAYMNPYIPCNGWQVDATVDITGNETSIVAAHAGVGYMFDDIVVSPALAVHYGDRVHVVITFTVF
jgi:hypothetical protein